VGSNKTIRVLYCRDSDAYYSVMQADCSLVMRYSTRGINMPLSSAVVRLNVSFFVISFTCWSCFLLTVTPQVSHLRMIDHQRIRPPPRFCPCIAVRLPLRARWLVTIQESICRNQFAGWAAKCLQATSLSHGSTCVSNRLSLRSRIDEF
jgi:hypothetical protein